MLTLNQKPLGPNSIIFFPSKFDYLARVAGFRSVGAIKSLSRGIVYFSATNVTKDVRTIYVVQRPPGTTVSSTLENALI